MVGVFRNGEGRCVMLRAELDALLIREETDLSYECDKSMEDMRGQEQPVMHAAGHDLHMASMLAAATLMRNAVSHWHGTLVIVFQPNKVHAKGAQAMMDAGLYTISPVPDAIFAQHSGPYPAGHISFVHGPALMSWDTVKIKLYCSLGYRANPQTNTNPVTLASAFIDGLERLAENDHNCAHITVKKVHAESHDQNSASQVDLVLEIKTDDEDLRRRILAAIFPKAEEVCRQAGVEFPPRVETLARAPLTLNDPGLAGLVQDSFSRHFGEDKVRARTSLSFDCDDIARLAEPHGTPYVVWHLGRQVPSNVNHSDFEQLIREVPLNDSPLNAPAPRPTLQTGTDALALAALSLLSWTSEDEDRTSVW